MKENELWRQFKNTIKFCWVSLIALIIGQVCVFVYAIKSLVNFKSEQIKDNMIISITWTIIILSMGAALIVKQIIPLVKDKEFYKNKDVERMRAVVINVKWIRRNYYKVTFENLETREEFVFDMIGKTRAEKDKIYDIIYLKHSKIYEFTPVSFEQLTEDNREKASKIDFNQKD